MSSLADIAVLACDRESAPGIRSSRQVRVLRRHDPVVWGRAKHLFVMCSASGLPDVAEVTTAANRQHRLRALFVRENLGPGFLGPMLDRANLRLLRNLVVHHGSTLPMRVLRAWEVDSQDALIAEASISDGRLFILSCALERFEIPIDRVPPLAALRQAQLRKFLLSEDGSYLHWPDGDVHLDLDAFRYLVDPVARRRMDVARAAHDRRFGSGVAAVRHAMGLSQSEIPGVSERQVRRIEAGSLPRVSTLERLAGAHRMTLDQYLAEVARRGRVGVTVAKARSTWPTLN